jgi:hypothetical protein
MYIAKLHDWIVVAIIFYQVCPHCALELPNATRIVKVVKKTQHKVGKLQLLKTERERYWIWGTQVLLTRGK